MVLSSDGVMSNMFMVNSVARGDMSALKLSSLPFAVASTSMTVGVGAVEASRARAIALAGGNGCSGAILRFCGYEKFCCRFRVVSSANDAPIPSEPKRAALSNGEC